MVSNQTKIAAAIRKKDEKLKHIMENETYNTAKTILEKYAPHLQPSPRSFTPVPMQVRSYLLITLAPITHSVFSSDKVVWNGRFGEIKIQP